MPEMEIKQAVDLFHQACSAEERGEVYVAEVYYLKSAFAFESVGGKYVMHAANALNALAFLRKAHGNYEGAIYSAKKSLQITKKFENQFSNLEVELVRTGAWDLIDELINPEASLH